LLVHIKPEIMTDPSADACGNGNPIHHRRHHPGTRNS
jgi:hypothetical protein